MVQNYIETLVNKVMKTEFADDPQKYGDICKCPSCVVFIKATALNQLKPYYVTSLAGEVFGEYASKELQNLSDVLVAVTLGVEALRREGRHRPGSPEWVP